MQIQLARTIANLAIFLEFTSDDHFDPDLVVKGMEQMAGDLQTMSMDDQKRLADIFHLIAGEYEGEYKEYVLNFPEAFGLREIEE